MIWRHRPVSDGLLPRTSDVGQLFLSADTAYERGDFEDAFATFLKLAESGDLSGMERVACMYGDGEGISRSRDKSLERDLKAAALGSTTSMFNLGITYRNSGHAREAKRWFEALHAVGDGDASLELAKMYMISDLEEERIRSYLLAVVQSSNVCEASREEAQRLLDDSNGVRQGRQRYDRLDACGPHPARTGSPRATALRLAALG